MKIALVLVSLALMLTGPAVRAVDDWEGTQVSAGRMLPALLPPYWLYEQWNKDWDWERNSAYTGNLFGRDLNIALIGDSLSTGFYYDGNFGSAWINRTCRQRNWYLDSDGAASSINSLYERLGRRTGVQATIYARAGAIVEGVNFSDPLYRRILGDIDDLTDQVDRISRERVFPNLILSWIGHNNMSWVNDLELHPELGIDARLREIPRAVRREYGRQMRRLLRRARSERYPVAIVIYGLYDWDSFARSRDAIGEYRKTHPRAYRYFDYADETVHCLKPRYRALTSALKRATEAQLKELVEELNHEIEADPQPTGRARFFYSEAFSRTELHPEDLHPVDGWHPSAHLHQRFAAAVEQDLDAPGGPLEFLQDR